MEEYSVGGGFWLLSRSYVLVSHEGGCFSVGVVEKRSNGIGGVSTLD